jgi:hypothetical protein
MSIACISPSFPTKTLTVAIRTRPLALVEAGLLARTYLAAEDLRRYEAAVLSRKAPQLSLVPRKKSGLDQGQGSSPYSHGQCFFGNEDEMHAMLMLCMLQARPA